MKMNLGSIFAKIARAFLLRRRCFGLDRLIVLALFRKNENVKHEGKSISTHPSDSSLKNARRYYYDRVTLECFFGVRDEGTNPKF
jgi:hypothetical protein